MASACHRRSNRGHRDQPLAENVSDMVEVEELVTVQLAGVQGHLAATSRFKPSGESGCAYQLVATLSVAGLPWPLASKAGALAARLVESAVRAEMARADSWLSR